MQKDNVTSISQKKTMDGWDLEAVVIKHVDQKAIEEGMNAVNEVLSRGYEPFAVTTGMGMLPPDLANPQPRAVTVDKYYFKRKTQIPVAE